MEGTKSLIFIYRDTEDSGPAEFPPEQPEADTVEDDGATYGAEEVELEEGLKAELAAEEAKVAAEGEDEEMDGADETAGNKEKDEDSDVGSEDLEAESSGSEDEDAEEEEGDGDEDMEMGEGEQNKGDDEKHAPMGQHAEHAEVMVH